MSNSLKRNSYPKEDVVYFGVWNLALNHYNTLASSPNSSGRWAGCLVGRWCFVVNPLKHSMPHIHTYHGMISLRNIQHLGHDTVTYDRTKQNKSNKYPEVHPLTNRKPWYQEKSLLQPHLFVLSKAFKGKYLLTWHLPKTRQVFQLRSGRL